MTPIVTDPALTPGVIVVKTSTGTTASCERVRYEDLERTRGRKRICPLCGQAGWGDFWWSTGNTQRTRGRPNGHKWHIHHLCERCGKWRVRLATHKCTPPA